MKKGVLVEEGFSNCNMTFFMPLGVSNTSSDNFNLKQAAKDEISRAVVGRGTVVRYMRDGSTQKLFATGKQCARVIVSLNLFVA